MRDNYDFSNGIRGKYAGKVDSTDIRLVSSAKTAEHANGKNGNNGLDAPGVRSETSLDALRKRARGKSCRNP